MKESTLDLIPLEVEEIPYKKVRKLFHLDYYDGDLSGICKYNNKIYYYDCWELDDGDFRTLTVEEEKFFTKYFKENKKKVHITFPNRTEETHYITYKDLEVSYEPNEEEGSKWWLQSSRKYYLYEISFLQKISELFWYKIFRLLVSDNCSYDEQNKSVQLTYIRPKYISNLYYKFLDPWRKKGKDYKKHRTRYHKNKKIGWFC